MSDDLISRQAAIKEVKIGMCGGWDCGVLDKLEALPTEQPEWQWIPWDSGRFPDDSGTYIVTAYDGAKERVTFAKYQKRLKRWELTGARSYWRVLAWMPLPKPYKEGGAV